MSWLPFAMLIAVGSAEAVVYLFRYRSAVQHSAARSALATFLVAGLRIAWLYTGVWAFTADAHPALVLLCYAGAASGTDFIAHPRRDALRARGAH